MKEKFMRFMQGRYGVLDTLGKVLLVLGLVLGKPGNCTDFPCMYL